MDDLPEVSILIPVFERSEFLNLTLFNIKSQSYPHNKLRVVIDECKSANPFIKGLDEYEKVCDYLYPIPVIHNVYPKKSPIGFKRNRLVKTAQTKYCQFFDTDDLYKPNAIRYNYDLLREKRVKCVGSDKMIFCYTKDDFKVTGIDCGNQIHMIHEATLFFDRKWFASTPKFATNSKGEGKKLLEGLSSKLVGISDVTRVMICLVHQTNTISKDRFKSNLVDINPEVATFLKGILQKKDD